MFHELIVSVPGSLDFTVNLMGLPSEPEVNETSICGSTFAIEMKGYAASATWEMPVDDGLVPATTNLPSRRTATADGTSACGLSVEIILPLEIRVVSSVPSSSIRAI